MRTDRVRWYLLAVGLWLAAAVSAGAAAAPLTRAVSYKGGKASAVVPLTGAPGQLVTVAPAVTGGAGWLTVSTPWAPVNIKLGKTGSGKIAIKVLAQPNDSVAARTATIDVRGATLAVTQAGAPCQLTVTPARAAIHALGGTVSAQVQAPAGCGWTMAAAAPAPWLELSSPASGEGSARVEFSAGTNTVGKSRTGKIVFTPQVDRPKTRSVSVTQAKADLASVVQVTGRVLDSANQPVADATVTITSTPVVVTTDDTGTFAASVAPGEHFLAIAKGGVTFCERTFLASTGSPVAFADILPTVPYYQEGGDDTAPSVGDYLPHAKDSTWTFTTTAPSGSTTFTNTVVSSTSDQWTVRSEYGDGANENYYINHESSVSIARTAQTYNGTTTVILYSPPLLAFVADISVGSNINRTTIAIYNYGGSVYSYSTTISYEVLGLETVTVPAGTFSEALKVKGIYTTNGISTVVTLWFAKGVGLVKSIMGQNGTVLTSYDVK